MIGQVAALRDAVTTVAELHAEVSAGATERLAHLPDPPPLRKRPAPRPADVAIVGMSCFYPGSPDVHAFWANVVDGADCVTEVPRERWDPAIYYDPESNDGTGRPRPSGAASSTPSTSIPSTTASRPTPWRRWSRCSSSPSRRRAGPSTTPATPTGTSTGAGPR